MPVNLEFDFTLNGNGYMLARDNTNRGRAWQRGGEANIPSRKQVDDVKYGDLPDDIDHPEVWEDWSGGFGDYYRLDNQRNHYHYAENMDARFAKQLIHAQQPQLLPARYASVNINCDSLIDVPLPSVSVPPAGAGTVLAVGRGYVASFTPTNLYNTAGSAFDFAYEATGGGALGFGHHPAVFGSFTWLPNINGSGFYRRGHDLTYTLSDCLTARWFEVAAGRMWRSHGRGYVQSVAIGADPLVTANWSATLNLGNNQMISDGAATSRDKVYVGFPDGLYQGDTSGTFGNVCNELGDAVTSDSVRDIMPFESGLAFGFGAHAYLFIPSDGANSSMYEISPVAAGGNRSPIRGRWTCFTGFGPWLYGGLFTGSQSYVMVARDASGGPVNDYVWHPLQKLPHAAKISRIHVDSISTASGGQTIPQRIWVATDATFGAAPGGTAPLYQWPVPYGDDNPVNITTFSANYCGSARIDFGLSNWDMPSTTKVFRSIEITADNLASGAQWIDVYYTIDGTPRTLLGTATVSPKTTLFFPGLNNKPGQGFARGVNSIISLESFTASFNICPITRSVVIRGTARPPAADEIQATVAIGDNISDRRGNRMRPGATMMAELRQMAQSDQPARLMDLTGAGFWVAVRNPIAEQEVYQGGENNPEIAATVKMAVMDFTTNTISSAGENQVLAQYTNDQLALNTNAQLEFY